MRADLMGKVSIAAVILLAPGGFVIGAAMAADHYRKVRRKRLGRTPGGDFEAARLDPATVHLANAARQTS